MLEKTNEHCLILTGYCKQLLLRGNSLLFYLFFLHWVTYFTHKSQLFTFSNECSKYRAFHLHFSGDITTWKYKFRLSAKSHSHKPDTIKLLYCLELNKGFSFFLREEKNLWKLQIIIFLFKDHALGGMLRCQDKSIFMQVM